MCRRGPLLRGCAEKSWPAFHAILKIKRFIYVKSWLVPTQCLPTRNQKPELHWEISVDPLHNLEYNHNHNLNHSGFPGISLICNASAWFSALSMKSSASLNSSYQSYAPSRSSSFPSAHCALASAFPMCETLLPTMELPVEFSMIPLHHQ